MHRFFYFRLFIVLLFSGLSISILAKTPPNDSCSKAKIIKIGGSGFGIGTYQSDSVKMDSATVQVGEFFHSSLITAGNDKKTIWFKFYIPTRRGISVELKQNANSIAIKDCGFTSYFSNTCLPGSTEATAAKLTTLDQFGSSFHPCMDPGWYMIQVSAKTRAVGRIYIEITTSFPYESSAITNAEYDAQDSAYDFGDDLVGEIGHNTKSVNFDLGCYTIKDSTELFYALGRNYKSFNQSAWFTFKAKNNSDFTQIKINAATSCFDADDTAAFRLFKGDCRGSSPLQLIDSNFSNFSNSSTCYSYCYEVVKQYKCLFDSGEFYSFQVLFKHDEEKNVRITLESNNSEFDSGYNQPKVGFAKELGIVTGENKSDYGFSCGSYINNNVCGNAMPASGVKLNKYRYNLSQWATFTLAEQTRLQINFSYSTNGNYQFYDQTGFRLFKDTVTSNCADIDTSSLIHQGRGSVNDIVDCLEPGKYVIQLLGTDSIVPYSNWKCQGSLNLGRDYRLTLNAKRLPVRNLLSLFLKGEADSLNAINNKIEPLPKWKAIKGNTDTISCNNTLLPESSCDSTLTKAIYRVFKIGDVTGDGIADSGMVSFDNLNAGYYTPQNYRLYKGNALTRRDNQKDSTYPYTLKGLKPYTKCFNSNYYYYTENVCIEPGEYTLVSFFNNVSLGLTQTPTINFYHAKSKFDKHTKAEFIDSLDTYKTYYSKPDTFTCYTNRDTIDGISCGSRNSYHVFYLDTIADATIGTQDYYSTTTYSLFHGDIRKGKGSLKLHVDRTRKWSCIASNYYGYTTPDCEPLQPGWYTIVVSKNGPDYDSVNRHMSSVGSELYAISKVLYITISKPTVIPTLYYRPSKAAFVDSLINNNKPLSFDKNYNTKSKPQHLAKFSFPREYLECDLDTPMNHFPKSALCDNNTTDIVYYVFTLQKAAFVRLATSLSYTTKVKMYNFDVRKDSAKLATATPIQNCNYNPNYLEFCNLQPGKYTLVYLVKRQVGNR